MATLLQKYLDTVEEYRAKDEGIYQDVHVHHILPRCCGGTDDKNNLVKVTVFHHVMLHKLILSNIKGITPVQREKLVYAYKKMRCTYLEPTSVAHKKRKKKPQTQQQKDITADLRQLYAILKTLEYRYRELSYVDTSLLKEIQEIKKWIRTLNHNKNKRTHWHQKYLKSGLYHKIKQHKIK